MRVSTFISTLLAGLAAVQALAGSGGASGPFLHGDLTQLLRRVVQENGEVDYDALRRHPEALARYLRRVAESSPAKTPGRFRSRDDEFAYWINAYNALVLDGVRRHPGMESVLDPSLGQSFFTAEAGLVGGRSMSLNEIEDKLRRMKPIDPRFHFALVCAAVSCPRLARQAYEGEELDRQLSEAAREFLNDPRHVWFDEDNGELVLSMIFRWYAIDFTGRAPAEKRLLRYLAENGLERIARGPAGGRAPRIRFSNYDWRLNRLHSIEPASLAGTGTAHRSGAADGSEPRMEVEKRGRRLLR